MLRETPWGIKREFCNLLNWNLCNINFCFLSGFPIRNFLPTWRKFLRKFPYPWFSDWILHGLEFGFPLIREFHPSPLHCQNHKIPHKALKKVQKWLHEESSSGRMLGPFSKDSLPTNAFISPIGVVPKNVTDFRIIHDLSYPQKSTKSLNDAIFKDRVSCSYPSTKYVTKIVQNCGPSAFVWKIDLKSAYRQIPLHSSEATFLGLSWREKFYFDCALPFGCRSSPALFSMVMIALMWAISDQNPNIRGHVDNYLDDIFGVAGTEDEANQFFHHVIKVVEALGIKINQKKVFTPRQKLKILGFCYDCPQQQICIPTKQIDSICSRISDLLRTKQATVKEIHSLVGKIQWTADVIWFLPCYLRSLRHLISKREPSTLLTLNHQCIVDLQRLQQIMQHHHLIQK